jgi:pimeloyl-ACP methyl ester carboxylesterase
LGTPFQIVLDELAYFDTGKSQLPTLLLIHGFGEDHCIWKEQIAFLSKYFRVIAPN